MKGIRFHDVSFSYDGLRSVLANLTIDLTGTASVGQKPKGHITAIVGASGSGKTTILRLIAGLERPSSGRIEHAGEGSCSPGYLFQQPVIFEHLTIRENAEYYRRLRGLRHRFRPDVFAAMAESLQLSSLIQSKQRIDTLSGGERQRVTLLRELAVVPDLLLLDEPAANLDVGVRNEFLLHLREAADRLGTMVLYVTHHFDEARLIADDVLYLPRVGSGSRASKATVRSMLEVPPSLEAARLLNLPVINSVSVSPGPRSNVVFIGSVALKVTPVTAVNERPRLIAFGPDALAWCNHGSFSTTDIASSSEHAIVSIDGVSGYWVAPPRPRTGRTLTIDGEVLIFSSVDSAGCRARIRPLSEECA